MSKEDATPQPLDPVAAELARHARFALEGGLDAHSALRRSLRRAASYAEQQFRHTEALEYWAQLTGVCETPDRGWVMVREARQMFFARWIADAENRLRQALVLAGQVADAALQARALSTLGSVLRQTERGNETGPLYQQALEIQRTLGNPGLLAGDLGNLGIFYESEGQFDLAESTYKEALALSRQHGTVEQQARILGYLGDLFRDTGRMEEGLRLLTEANQISAKGSDQPELALSEERLGIWHALNGEFEKADQRLAKAIAMYEATGNLRSLGMALGNLGSQQFDRGQHAQAEATMLRALQIHEEVGNTAFQPTTLGNLGAVRLKAADIEGAEAYYRRAVELAPHSRSPAARGGAMLGHALCLAILGRRPEAISKWAEGSRVLQQCQAGRELETRHQQMREECQKAGIEPLA